MGRTGGLYIPRSKQLDTVDKAAIKRWRKNVTKARKKGQLKFDDGVLLQDLSKMVNLYKIYGNDDIAMVNPADDPGILQVRTRSAERRRLNKQMGLVKEASRSNLDPGEYPFTNEYLGQDDFRVQKN